MKDDISILADFSNRILAVDSFAKLSNLLIENITKATKPQYASFMLFDMTTLDLLVEKRRGFHQKRSIPPTIELCDESEQCRSPHGSMIVLPGGKTPQFFLFFDAEEPHTCEIRIPFTLCENYLGLINLGKKQSGQEYDDRELDYMQVFTNYMTTATFKSRLCPSVTAHKKADGHQACSPTWCSQTAVIKPRIRVSQGGDKFGLLGDSPAMHAIRDLVAQVAVEDVPVLITGESGTGKELIAHAIHAASKRAGKPLVAVNCAALPEALVESELFGHEKGAFTGAIEQKKGKFEFADTSSLFLDEIGDMSLATQAKLLRVLQDGTFCRVGGNASLHADVRVIAATNKDLYEMSRENMFREDLYYRLNVVPIEAPPLRQRGDDILLLANYYLDFFNNHYRKNLHGFSDAALAWLQHHDFPGNVRELKNIIERAIILEKSDKITPDSFPKPKYRATIVDRSAVDGLRDLEREHILAVMQQVNHNKSEAARRLGIARKTLREKLQKYENAGIENH